MVRRARIPLVDLVRQYRGLRTDILRAVDRVLTSGAYILGPEVESFEEELARCCGTRYAVGLASGTDALELALRALGIGRGDEVITTPFTFMATAEVIVEVGARPVFADIDPVSWLLDPSQAERTITRRTRAIMPVHLYGQPADMEAFGRLARRYHLRLIEDCAQAIGATWHRRHVGSFGDAGCFSFYPSKNLGTYGDGGALVTNSAALAQRVRLLRGHGARDKYHHIMHGVNSRLDEVHAAMLRIKLRRLPQWNARRRRVARWYAAAFRAAGVAPERLPSELPGRRHVYHVYAVSTRQRRALQAQCAREGIGTVMHYPLPLHRQPALRWLGYRRGSLPHSERAAQATVSLPMFPEMTRAEVERVVRVVRPYLLTPS